MKGNHRQASSGLQQRKRGVQPLGKPVQFSVDRDPQRLKGLSCGMSISSCRRGVGVFHDLRKLKGRFNGSLFPGRRNSLGDPFGKPLLAIPAENFGKLLPGQAVDKIPRAGALLAHTHIQGSVAVIGKSPFRGIKLVRGNADIHQHAVHAVNAEASDNLLHLREIRPANSNPRVIGKPFGDGRDSVRVLVDGNQPACGKPLGDGL